MARVVLATAFGGPEVLAVVEQVVEPPRAGEVRLAVRAAGVNPIDWKRYGSGSANAELPMRLGFEAAGLVREVAGEAIGPAERDRGRRRGHRLPRRRRLRRGARRSPRRRSSRSRQR